MDEITRRLHRQARALEQLKRQQAEQGLGVDLCRELDAANAARVEAELGREVAS